MHALCRQALVAHLLHGVLAAPWQALQAQLSAVQSFEGLQAAHAAYLRACSEQCFLQDAQVVAWRSLHRLLQCAESLALAASAHSQELHAVARIVRKAVDEHQVVNATSRDAAVASSEAAASRLLKTGGRRRMLDSRSSKSKGAPSEAASHCDPALAAAVREAVVHRVSPACEQMRRAAEALRANISGLVRGVLLASGVSAEQPAPQAAVVLAAAESAGLFSSRGGGGGVPAMLGFVRDALDFNGFYQQSSA
jgi:hypothetical protein